MQQKPLDTPSRLRYKPSPLRGLMLGLIALLSVFTLAALLPTSAQAAGEFRHRGVLLPGGSVRVGEDRFRLPDNFSASLRFYRSHYNTGRFPRKAIVDQPGIKAIHVVNPDSGGAWDGFNIYEHQREVRVYILPRD